jgi:hypothetical protein
VRACRRVAALREEPGAVRRTETWPGASSYVAHPRFGRCPCLIFATVDGSMAAHRRAARPVPEPRREAREYRR